MNVSLPKSLVFGITVLGAAVILLWGLSKAYTNGKLVAQSERISQNAMALAEGFNYFYNDQNRYPSADEFTASSQSPLSMYFNVFPPAQFSSPLCTSSFVYKRPSVKNYELSFCIPKAVAGLGAGFNRITK